MGATSPRLDGHWSYDYDDTAQLTHAVFASTTTNIPSQDLAYVYDAVGNRVRTVENGVTAILIMAMPPPAG